MVKFKSSKGKQVWLKMLLIYRYKKYFLSLCFHCSDVWIVSGHGKNSFKYIFKFYMINIKCSLTNTMKSIFQSERKTQHKNQFCFFRISLHIRLCFFLRPPLSVLLCLLNNAGRVPLKKAQSRLYIVSHVYEEHHYPDCILQIKIYTAKRQQKMTNTSFFFFKN